MQQAGLHRHYSPAWLGGLLTDCLPETAPSLIVDLGCGPGVLSGAAGARWADASLVTVDLDRTLVGPFSRPLTQSTTASGRRGRHVLADATMPRLGRTIGVGPGAVDVALSNPPYAIVTWRPGFDTIMRRVGLDRALSAGRSAPLDVIFLAQALHLLRPGGSLGFIVPDSTISGVRCKPLRALMLRMHGIECVVQLPRGAFRNTDAQAFAIVLRKGLASERVRLDRVDGSGRWSSPVVVDRVAGTERLDHAYHAAGMAEGETLEALGVEIRRGRISSSEIGGAGRPVFHTTDFPREPGGAVFLGEGGILPPGAVETVRGDILIARIDRRLEEKVALVAEGRGEISDCVMRLRCPPEVRGRVLRGLTGFEGQARLRCASRGTGARHVTAAALRALVV